MSQVLLPYFGADEFLWLQPCRVRELVHRANAARSSKGASPCVHGAEQAVMHGWLTEV